MRLVVAAAITLWLTPVIAAGVYVFAGSAAASVAIAFVLAAGAAWLTAPRLADTIAPAVRRPAVAVIVAILAAAAIAQIARMSIYMANPARTDCSYFASDPWRSRHACMTAYAEAMRFSAQPGTNIYEMGLYEPRTIGPLKVDSFHYPPPFLLLPAAVHAIGPDVFEFRALWYVLQALMLAAVVFGLAQWIGGPPGAYAAAGGVLAFGTPQFLFALQQGNVQSTAMPIAALGLVLLWRRRPGAGAPLLAYMAAAKIFPGILVVWLAAARQWKAVAATAVCGAAVVALTLGIFGTRPFEDFVRHELPRISNGEAFPQSETIGIAPNLSVYGNTVRLRALGLASLTRPRGLAIASIYGVLVIALAALAGWRYRPDFETERGRLRFVQVALALLLLASMRSPFVGFYGFMAAVWLGVLIAAEQRTDRAVLFTWLAVAVFSGAHLLIPSPLRPTTPSILLLGGTLVTIAIAACAWIVIRVVRTAPVSVPRHTPVYSRTAVGS